LSPLTISLILSSSKIHNGDILVLGYPVYVEKMAVKMDREKEGGVRETVLCGKIAREDQKTAAT